MKVVQSCSRKELLRLCTQVLIVNEDKEMDSKVKPTEKRAVLSIDVQLDPNDEYLQGIPGPLTMPREDPLQRAGPGKQRHGHCLSGRWPANASEL